MKVQLNERLTSLDGTHMSHCNSPSPTAKTGLSLLEVVLSLAILSVAAAYLAQSVFLATENAIRSQELTQAELVAESLMNQIVAGVLPAQSVNWVSYNTPNPLGAGATNSELRNWVYSISNVRTEVQGMIGVQIAVQQVNPGETPSQQPTLTVTRWIIDPSLGLDQPPAATNPAGTSSPTSTASSAGSGSSAGVGALGAML